MQAATSQHVTVSTMSGDSVFGPAELQDQLLAKDLKCQIEGTGAFSGQRFILVSCSGKQLSDEDPVDGNRSSDSLAFTAVSVGAQLRVLDPPPEFSAAACSLARLLHACEDLPFSIGGYLTNRHGDDTFTVHMNSSIAKPSGTVEDEEDDPDVFSDYWTVPMSSEAVRASIPWAAIGIELADVVAVLALRCGFASDDSPYDTGEVHVVMLLATGSICALQSKWCVTDHQNNDYCSPCTVTCMVEADSLPALEEAAPNFFESLRNKKRASHELVEHFGTVTTRRVRLFDNDSNLWVFMETLRDNLRNDGSMSMQSS